jgi:hypothetical protein
MTMEHIVPFALGGSNRFTISTCKSSNNDLGSEVDAPFQDFFSVRVKRFFLGLESTGGNEPSLDLGGIGTIDGKEVPISYLIQRDTRELKIAAPVIVKTKNPNGTERWQVSGDPAKVREIIEGKLRKQLKLGKTLTSDDGKVLQLEDLEALFAANETVTENPCVTKTIHFDPTMPVRFFSKLALAVGHFHLGEVFSRSPSADRLRQHMRVTDYSEVQLSGAIWPYTESIQTMLGVIAKPDHHTLAIVDGTPRYFLASLFGEYGALIQLDGLPEGQAASTTGTGSVWRIALPSRQLRTMTMNELYTEHAAELQRAMKEAKT